MYFMGLTSNLMSLAASRSRSACSWMAHRRGRESYKRLEEWIAGGRKGDFHAVRLRALQEVGPSVFFRLVIAVAFLPVFTLVDQEGASQAARLLEESRDGDRRDPCGDTRPGDADDVHAHGNFRVRRAGLWHRQHGRGRALLSEERIRSVASSLRSTNPSAVSSFGIAPSPSASPPARRDHVPST